MKKIGILSCGYVREEIAGKHGEYNGFFKRLLKDEDFTFIDYFVVDGIFPENVTDCDAYIITGSAYGVYEDHDFIPPLEDFIRQAYNQNIPQIGICFGHQILAQALGGRVIKFDKGWGLGVHSYKLKTDEGVKTIKLNAVHQDQVVEKPKEAEIICSSDFCENAGLAYGKKAISFQPHPEFEEGFMVDLINLRSGKSFSEETANKALSSMESPAEGMKIGSILKDFIKSNTKCKT